MRRVKAFLLLFICVLFGVFFLNTKMKYSYETNRISFKSLKSKFFGEDTFNSTWCGHGNITEVDVLCMKPPSFFRNYKNPCWMHNGKLRCYPYFHLIGMDKSGTSDLFSRLAKHPDIYGNNGTLGKETQWWPCKKYGMFMMKSIKKESFDDYLKYFLKTTATIEAKVNQHGYHVGITGDGTPMDSWDFSGWPQIPQNAGLKEPKFTTPDLIKHIYPDVKLIMIMRNPVDRLYSDYFFIGLGGTTPQNFHGAVLQSIAYLKDCMVQRSLRMCLYDRQMHLKWNTQARIHLGFYFVFLLEWLKVFPRSQFLFLKTEQYSRNISEALRRTFDFLEVRTLSPAEYTTYGIAIKERKHTTKGKPREPMLNETRQILYDLYKPFNNKLADLLNDAAFTWNGS